MEQVVEMGKWAAYLVGAGVFALGGMTAARWLSPRRPGGLKGTAYECGEAAKGDAWGQIHVRFYVMGLIFLIFDVELLMLYPWAVALTHKAWVTAAPSWPWVALLEGAAFILILAAGLAYVWGRGDVNWSFPPARRPHTPTPVPDELYARLNEKYASSQP
jgi:NADH-quinone oxidoreductase subunit A